VRYSRAEPFSTGEQLFVAMGGLALELILSIVCLWWARRLQRGSLPQLAVLGIGIGLLLHCLHYVAGGTFHGYGDPWVLYTDLGSARVYVAVAVAVVMCGAGFFLARYMAGLLRGLLARHSARTQLAIIVAAVLTAGAAHATLAFGEQAIAPNRTYKATFKSVSERQVEAGVRRYRVMLVRRRGRAPSAEELARVRRRLKRTHATFPFALVISVCLGLAVIAGMVVARPVDVTAGGVPTLGGQRNLALVAVSGLALVGILRAFS